MSSIYAYFLTVKHGSGNQRSETGTQILLQFVTQPLLHHQHHHTFRSSSKVRQDHFLRSSLSLHLQQQQQRHLKQPADGRSQTRRMVCAPFRSCHLDFRSLVPSVQPTNQRHSFRGTLFPDSERDCKRSLVMGGDSFILLLPFLSPYPSRSATTPCHGAALLAAVARKEREGIFHQFQFSAGWQKSE